MRAAISALTVLTLTMGMSGYVLADSDTSRVIVRVKAVDRLSVSDGGALVLDGSPGGSSLGPVSDTTAVLRFTHNENATKKIAAEAKASDSPDPTGNDLTIRVLVQDGAGARTLYNDAGTTGPQAVVTGVGPGALNQKSVTYTAQCTSTGTEVSVDTDFSFIITFTSVDE